jgi:hypothetical protein
LSRIQGRVPARIILTNYHESCNARVTSRRTCTELQHPLPRFVRKGLAHPCRGCRAKSRFKWGLHPISFRRGWRFHLGHRPALLRGFAMNKLSLAWTIWRLLVVLSLWVGFERHWPFSIWIQLGLVLLCPVVIGGLSFWWRTRFARGIAALSAEDRRSRLAAMPLKRREYVLQWIERHEDRARSYFAKVHRNEPKQKGVR